MCLKEDEAQLLHQIDYGIFLWALDGTPLCYIFLFSHELGDYWIYTVATSAWMEDRRS
jgi:hypothetical protein